MKAVKFLAPNQCYFFQDNKIVFQSYETIICTIENYENGNEPIIKITDSQPQSKTTAKYLNQFLQLHTSFKSYKDIK
jgi:predicted ABC-type transport system involved in lysophospholipase L1 biosynthesis ATPase subunit